MQVSWIDPEEISALLAQIEGPLPRPAANNFAWELNTLPVVPMDPLAAENMVEGPSLRQGATAPPPPPPTVSEFPLSEQRSGPASGDLWRIRERLRSLREQAQESGILPRGEELAVPEEETAVPPVAVETPPPPPPPETIEASLALDSVTDEWDAEYTSLPEAPPPLPPEMIEASLAPDSVTDEWEAEYTSLPEAPLPAPSEIIEPSLPPDSVTAEWEAEYTSLPEAPPLPLPEDVMPAEEQEVLTSQPSMILPTPAQVFDPVDLPSPTPPPLPIGSGAIEYSGPAPDSPAYEPLFSLAPPPPPLSVPFEIAPPELPAAAVAAASPFSIVEPEPQPEPAAEPDKPPFVVPQLGLSDRLSALAHWATARLGTGEVLLVDDYGDVLWGGNAQTPLVLSAMMAWHAAQRSTAESACSEPHRIDKDLANGRALTVLPARTRYGVVSLAAIQQQPMSEVDEQAIRAALILAVEGSEQV